MTEYEADQEEGPPPHEDRPPAPVEVPLSMLSPAALAGVIDAFILREGTDYGERETSHETKVEQIKRQLDRGDIRVIYDLTQESVTLMTKRDWEKFAPADAEDA